MADVEVSIAANTADLRSQIELVGAGLRKLNGELKNTADEMLARGASGAGPYMAALKDLSGQAETLSGVLRGLKAELASQRAVFDDATAAASRNAAAMAAQADAWPRWYSKLADAQRSAASLSSSSAPTPLRQFASPEAGEAETRLAVLRAQTAELRNTMAAQAALTAEQVKFSQAIAPQANIAAHRREEVATIAAAERALRAYDVEQERSDAQRAKFASQIAPQSRVRYAVGDAGEVRAYAAAARDAAEQTLNWERASTHAIPIFDGLARGQRRQAIASIGAALRDLGVSSAAAIGPLGILIGVMAAFSAVKAAEGMGKWAVEVREAAIAANMSIADYSQLQGALELSGLKATSADTALKAFAKNLSTANNPASAAAIALHNFDVSQEQIAEHSGDTDYMLRRVADGFVKYQGSANLAGNATALFDRNWKSVTPLLENGAAGLDALKAHAAESREHPDRRNCAGIKGDRRQGERTLARDQRPCDPGFCRVGSGDPERDQPVERAWVGAVGDHWAALDCRQSDRQLNSASG